MIRSIFPLQVTQIAVYPMFNKTTCLGDIAVLTLATAVVLSPYVAPVCLWDDNSVDLNEVEGKDGTVRRIIIIYLRGFRGQMSQFHGVHRIHDMYDMF